MKKTDQISGSGQTSVSHKSAIDMARRANELLRSRRFDEAQAVCSQLSDAYPDAPEGWILMSRAQQQRGDLDGMGEYAQKAWAIAPDRPDVALLMAEACMVTGRIGEAIQRLNDVVAKGLPEPAAWEALITLYTHMGKHQLAYDAAKSLAAKAPSSLAGPIFMSMAAYALGEMDEAEEILDDVLKRAPQEADCYYNRAVLRRQTGEHNHIQDLRQRLSTCAANDPAVIPVSFALAKELEDLGEYEESFTHLARGADERRKRMTYDVKVDAASLGAIAKTFDIDWVESAAEGFDIKGPIFVLGLPRSGTTLVERILGSHSDVGGLGEINDFAYAVMRAGRGAQNKQELIERAAKSDLSWIGQTYWGGATEYGVDGPKLIDKTPANFLYLGLIMKALPNAKIVHVRRHPMASCYAMYKTLFRMGYPFSYDQSDLAHYYAAYAKLMDHWRSVFPGRILDVEYENLVSNQEDVSRAIVSYCGLGWQDACLSFHENKSPTATASAAQVREPIYSSSVEIWRHYETQLAPLKRHLVAAGIDV